MMTGSQAVKLAAGYIGSGASTFYAYYSRNFSEFRSGNWCACFVSCIVKMAGAECAGLPGVYCPTMRNAGVAAGKAVAVAAAKPGDIVYFNWDSNQNADHVGMVESIDATARTITSIDGNVSNKVGRRTRKWSEVMSVIRPTYAKEQQVATKLLVDGIFGTVTCSALQRRLAALGYYKADVDGVFGPLTKRAYQSFLRDKGYYGGIIDGIFGVLSVKAEQRWLASVGCYPGAIDGARGPLTKKGLQMALNGGKL